MLDEVWQRRTHQRVHSLEVRSGVCVFTERRSWLTAVEASSGAELWSVKVRHSHGSIALTADRAFYLDGRSLHCFDLLSGRPQWSKDLGDVGRFSGWLHATPDAVVCGGWRNYTPIRAVDTRNGEHLWERPSGEATLYCTKVHWDSNSLLIHEAAGDLVFVDLQTGLELDRAPSPGGAVTGYLEQSTSVVETGAALVVDAGADGFVVVRGADRTMQTVSSDTKIQSKNLMVRGSVVPFVTQGGELAMWSLDNETFVTGPPLMHQPSEPLPFVMLEDQAFAVGSGSGVLQVFSDSETCLAKRRIGKRIGTNLTVDNDVLIVGTHSGQVLGLSLQA